MATSTEERLDSCNLEGGVLTFQMNVLEQVARKDVWFRIISYGSDGVPSLGEQMKKYYCLNLCYDRTRCNLAPKQGWVNEDIVYEANFLGIVRVVPKRDNPKQPYELFSL